MRTILAAALVVAGVQQLSSIAGKGFALAPDTRTAIRNRGLLLVGGGFAAYFWGRRLGLR